MKLRPEILTIKKKIEGNDVYILAGGPSLVNFDFDRLRGKTTIALNTSYKKIKEHVSGIFWTDNDWAAQHYDELIKLPVPKFSVRSQAGRMIMSGIPGFANSCVLHKESEYGYAMDINAVCGNNSGAQSLNLLTNMKPRRIFLLGYDMSYANGKTHWHEGYPLYDSTVYKNLFIPSIESMAPTIKRMNVEVINLNPESKLECFKKDNMDKYL